MPKIKGYTPAWLLAPSPGHDLFTPDSSEANSAPSYTSKSISKSVPRRTIARRGTEVFIAVGKEIRWADLVYLKERWEEKQAKVGGGVRIKREDSGSSDDELLRESIENGCAEGFRVSCPASSLLLSTDSYSLDNQNLRRQRYPAAHHITICELHDSCDDAYHPNTSLARLVPPHSTEP